jgi:hypothetical protein
MVPEYGVVVGQYSSYKTVQGQWLHVDLTSQARHRTELRAT